MATSKEYLDYVLENLGKIGDVSARKMMGEYCIYYQGADDLTPDGAEGRKLIGNICDNTLFLKPTDSVLRLMPDAERAYPYEGSKTLMVVVEAVEDVALMKKVLSSMYKELPKPKKTKRS